MLNKISVSSAGLILNLANRQPPMEYHNRVQGTLWRIPVGNLVADVGKSVQVVVIEPLKGQSGQSLSSNIGLITDVQNVLKSVENIFVVAAFTMISNKPSYIINKLAITINKPSNWLLIFITPELY